MSTSRRELVFLDSSLILRYFSGDPKAADVFESNYRYGLNSIVYSEVVFGLLRALYTEIAGRYSFYNMKKALKKPDTSPYLVKAYDIMYEFIGELKRENRLSFLQITYSGEIWSST